MEIIHIGLILFSLYPEQAVIFDGLSSILW